MALALKRGGTCNCGGEIWEVREGVYTPGGEPIYGPGRHVNWKCKDCDREYSFSMSSEEQEELKETLRAVIDEVNKK